jgi:PAS domain S-box-containing protein
MEDPFRLLIESVTNYAIFFLDPVGKVATWNTGAKQIKQYETGEIVGKHFSVFYPSDAQNQNYPAKALLLAKAQGKFEDEGWRLRKDGSVFWAHVLITPVYNQENKLIGFSNITRDLSESKKAEDDLLKANAGLKESEERYRLLVEGVNDYAIFMLDPIGNIISWNEGAKRIKGYEANEIIGCHFSKFYGLEAVQSGFPAYELTQAKAKGRFEDEGWRYRKDGSAFWANVIITAIYNSKEELMGFSKITRDLTERKQLEEQLFRTNAELKESAETIRLLIDSVKDYAIIMLNPKGLIISWNAGAQHIKGYQAAEIIGRHFSVFYSQEAKESRYPDFELAKAIENGRFEDEGWRIRKDGSAFWANVVLTPVYNSENRLLGFAKITRDLTERRRNEELMQKNKELLRINNDLDNFVYSASHDLKSPIANLEGLLMALQEDLEPDTQKHEVLLSHMEGALLTLKNVIADLALITRLPQEKETPFSINLPELLKEITEGLRPLILRTQAEIKVDVSGFENLKYARKNLRSILHNLLSNALKYADPQRAPEIRIRTSVSAGGEYVLSVADNGLGIPENQKSKIFSMFQRVHTHVEGSGIGLFLVKRILDNSDDRIEVESEVGKGSVFKVYFKQEKFPGYGKEVYE